MNTPFGVLVVSSILVLLSACGFHADRTTDMISYHHPGPPHGKSCHVYVTILSDGSFEIMKRYRSYNVNFGHCGTETKKGVIPKETLRKFVATLTAYGVHTIDEATVRQRLHAEEPRVFIADGLEFNYTVSWNGYVAAFPELSQYMDLYPAYPEFIIATKTKALMEELSEHLWESGVLQKESEPKADPNVK